MASATTTQARTPITARSTGPARTGWPPPSRADPMPTTTRPEGGGVALSSGRADTPRLAYSVLERRATLATSGVLLALAGVAWWATVARARGMSDMVQGLAQAG